MARYDPDRKGYRIFVGNLTSVTSHDDLADLFTPYGPVVDIWLACNPPGFGFVVYKNGKDAEIAAKETNNSILKGRVIKVQHARLFRDRSKRTVIGLHDDSDQNESRSRSVSRSDSRSRSGSRLRSGSRSGSGSSRDSFSRIYGESRPRSRTRSVSHSRSLSRSRSRSSRLTTSWSSRTRSRSGSVSSTKYRPRTKSRCSRNRRKHKKHRRRRHSHSSSSSATYDDSHSTSSRSQTTSSQRPSRRRYGCRHCRHCKRRASSTLSGSGASRGSSASSRSSREGGVGAKKRGRAEEHRRPWRRGRRYRRRPSSSSPSSASLRSSSPAKSPSRQRQKQEGAKPPDSDPSLLLPQLPKSEEHLNHEAGRQAPELSSAVTSPEATNGNSEQLSDRTLISHPTIRVCERSKPSLTDSERGMKDHSQDASLTGTDNRCLQPPSDETKGRNDIKDERPGESNEQKANGLPSVSRSASSAHSADNGNNDQRPDFKEQRDGSFSVEFSDTSQTTLHRKGEEAQRVPMSEETYTKDPNGVRSAHREELPPQANEAKEEGSGKCHTSTTVDTERQSKQSLRKSNEFNSSKEEDNSKVKERSDYNKREEKKPAIPVKCGSMDFECDNDENITDNLDNRPRTTKDTGFCPTVESDSQNKQGTISEPGSKCFLRKEIVKKGKKTHTDSSDDYSVPCHRKRDSGERYASQVNSPNTLPNRELTRGPAFVSGEHDSRTMSDPGALNAEEISAQKNQGSDHVSTKTAPSEKIDSVCGYKRSPKSPGHTGRKASPSKSTFSKKCILKRQRSNINCEDNHVTSSQTTRRVTHSSSQDSSCKCGRRHVSAEEKSEDASAVTVDKNKESVLQFSYQERDERKRSDYKESGSSRREERCVRTDDGERETLGQRRCVESDSVSGESILRNKEMQGPLDSKMADDRNSPEHHLKRNSTDSSWKTSFFSTNRSRDLSPRNSRHRDPPQSFRYTEPSPRYYRSRSRSPRKSRTFYNEIYRDGANREITRYTRDRHPEMSPPRYCRYRSRSPRERTTFYNEDHRDRAIREITKHTRDRHPDMSPRRSRRTVESPVWELQLRQPSPDDYWRRRRRLSENSHKKERVKERDSIRERSEASNALFHSTVSRPEIGERPREPSVDRKSEDRMHRRDEDRHEETRSQDLTERVNQRRHHAFQYDMPRWACRDYRSSNVTSSRYESNEYSSMTKREDVPRDTTRSRKRDDERDKKSNAKVSSTGDHVETRTSRRHAELSRTHAGYEHRTEHKSEDKTRLVSTTFHGHASRSANGTRTVRSYDDSPTQAGRASEVAQLNAKSRETSRGCDSQSGKSAQIDKRRLSEQSADCTSTVYAVPCDEQLRSEDSVSEGPRAHCGRPGPEDVLLRGEVSRGASKLKSSGKSGARHSKCHEISEKDNSKSSNPREHATTSSVYNTGGCTDEGVKTSSDDSTKPREQQTEDKTRKHSVTRVKSRTASCIDNNQFEEQSQTQNREVSCPEIFTSRKAQRENKRSHFDARATEKVSDQMSTCDKACLSFHTTSSCSTREASKADKAKQHVFVQEASAENSHSKWPPEISDSPADQLKPTLGKSDKPASDSEQSDSVKALNVSPDVSDFAQPVRRKRCWRPMDRSSSSDEHVHELQNSRTSAFSTPADCEDKVPSLGYNGLNSGDMKSERPVKMRVKSAILLVRKESTDSNDVMWSSASKNEPDEC